MEETRGLAAEIRVIEINTEGLLERPLQRRPLTQDGARAEAYRIEEML